ncbi:MAG: nucleotidyltransferase family protein, partial [Gaiellaceae bacterium]
ILAAGRGTRLGSLGKMIPKVLVEIDGQPLLERQLHYLERNGITHAVVNAHHHAAQILSFCERYSGSIELAVVTEQRLLGTAGGVRNALNHLRPGPFLVLYGDVLVDAPIEPMLTLHRQMRASATLAVHEAESAEGKGVVEVGKEDRIRGFTEKDAQTGGPFLINSGLYILEPDVVAPLALGVECDFGSDVFPALLAQGLPLYAARLAKPVIDIGTPQGLALARATVRTGALTQGPGLR